MEIQVLRLLLTEQDLRDLARRGVDAGYTVRDVAVRITPEGVHFSGVYPTSFLDVPFSTLWQLGVRQGKLAARLVTMQTGNGQGDLGLDVFSLISPGAVRGTLMNAVARAVQGDASFRVEGDTILVDPEHLAAQHGWPVRLNLRSVSCQPGHLLIESGTPG